MVYYHSGVPPQCTPREQPTPTPSTPPINASYIALEAEKVINSTLWSYASAHRTGCNTYKCNTFVAEMVDRMGGSVPHRYPWFSPIGAGEWANPRSTYLTNDPHWVLVTGTPRRGDVAACDGHVGIVTGPGTTVSAARNKVVQNDWGFRPGQTTTFWRYVP
ncbi:hypothetical protein LSAT2_030654 [Lamellibrachia satsuma]|nr:hypothetical protein LSAT2_030654 [Lamellibrachia satsuma]